MIQRCYERELRDSPTLAGRVVARFSIHPTGTVSGATTTESSTGSPAVATCVNAPFGAALCGYASGDGETLTGVALEAPGSVRVTPAMAGPVDRVVIIDRFGNRGEARL